MAKVVFARVHWRAAWQKRSWDERRLLLEAFCWLGLMRLLVVTLPFQWLLVLLRLQHRPLPTALPTPVAPHAVEPMRGAIQAVSGFTPWRSNCLAQALAAHRMLHRRRISSTLYLGVAKQADQPLTAHAWLRCGERFVTGEAGWQHFTPITCLERCPHPTFGRRLSVGRRAST